MPSLLSDEAVAPGDTDEPDFWSSVVNPDWQNGPVFTDEQLAAVRNDPQMWAMGLGDLTQPLHETFGTFSPIPEHADFNFGQYGNTAATPDLSGSTTQGASTGNSGGAQAFANNAGQSALKVCPPVNARVLQGNSNFIGHPGAWGLSVPITDGSAAIIRSEFGMDKGQLRPYLGQISGAINGQPLFNGVTDSIDNATPPAGAPAGMNTPRAFEYLNPRDIILEVQGIPKDLGVQPVTLSVPQQVNCPVPPSAKGK